MSNFKDKYQLKESISIMDYAVYLGYKIDKQKSSSVFIKMENTSNGDRILIGLKRGNNKEDLYKSLNDDNERGDILQFCQNRISGSVSFDKSKEGFYKTMVELNKFLGVYLSPKYKEQRDKNINFLEKKKRLFKSQNKNFNRIPIEDYSYFVNERKISKDTLLHPIFKDRLFNSFFVHENGHIFTNYAFGKYKKGELVGLEVRNKSLKSIVEDHEGIFITNTSGMDSIDVMFYCESGIDVASYFELLLKNVNYDPSKNYCLLSTGGFTYDKKMEVIMDTLTREPITNKTKFISITDNDSKGNYYDYHFTAELLNKYHTPLDFEKLQQNFYVYTFKDSEFIKNHTRGFINIINQHNKEVDKQYTADERYGKYVIYKELGTTFQIQFPITLNPTKGCFRDLMNSCNADRYYIPHKAKKDDWNQSLKHYKANIENKGKHSLISDTKKKSKLKL